MKWYSKTHIWFETENEKTVAGLSKHALDELNEIVLLSVDTGKFKEGDSFGVIESVKTASELICPCDMTVLNVNKDVELDPSKLDENTWIAEVKYEGDLITFEEYLRFVGK